MSHKTEREKVWRKANRRTLAFELTAGKDDDVLEFWDAVEGAKVDAFRALTRVAIANEGKGDGKGV